tara:strand:- start:11855 stop:13657 length:1803 start_codon:yes stop_codon:yes gene_type:complete
MTTTNTMDTDATVEQSIKMIDAGSEYVRITAPNSRQAQNLQNIKDSLLNKGYNTPLIADIHFTPSAAEIAAQIVEKVRINPGNYADKKKFKVREYTDLEYSNELERIHEKFSPLVKTCLKYKTTMRIGTNHGSLSDRIMNRYGDTPLGMVESALEFARICEIYNFHNIVFSMKASNPIIVVQAYRLLVKKMINENMNYPLHLGVTEAGDGEDGRIKSSLGIGTLLSEGIGDTIRVSLTEPPENEIPVAKNIVKRYSNYDLIDNYKNFNIIDSNFKIRETQSILNLGGKNVPRVIADFSYKTNISEKDLESVGYTYFKKDDKWGISDLACDFIYLGNNNINFKIPGTLNLIQNYSKWNENKISNIYPMMSINEYKNKKSNTQIKFLLFDVENFNELPFDKIKNDSSLVLISNTKYKKSKSFQFNFYEKCVKENIKNPVIISLSYNQKISNLKFQVNSSIDSGSLLIEGFGNGLLISNKNINLDIINRTCFNILQATRTRISKTEYISCPSCGRTLFDLEKTTAMIRSKTQHLKGVKIGIMGCIVNGPGEMADADYGYVGTGVGKISLYRGQKVVKNSIDTKYATDALIELIKEDGNWVEPK